MAQIVITIQLQTNGGVVMATATRTRTNFDNNDIENAISFLTSIRMQRIIAEFAGAATGEFSFQGTPVITI
jgi:hypothetical protein